MTKKRQWSADETVALRRLAGEGKLLDAIAEVMGSNPSSVRNRADFLGIEIRRSSRRARAADVCTHSERLAILALQSESHLPVGVGKVTKQGLLKKGWIEPAREAASGFRVTPLGEEALRRNIPIRN